MKPDLLNLDLPQGPVPELPPASYSVEENEAWHAENRRLRLMRGDDSMGFCPALEPFTTDGWPLD